MGVFKKTISDEEWLAKVKPFYKDSISVTNTLDKLVENTPLPDNGGEILTDALEKLTPIAESLKKLPNPTSNEARKAKVDIESGIKIYIKGAKEGVAFYKGMAGKLGDTYRSGQGLSNLAEATLGGILSNFLESIENAQLAMKKASAYFLKYNGGENG